MYLQFEVPNAFSGTSRWKGLKTIGMVVYKSMMKGEERIDIRYFISSLSRMALSTGIYGIFASAAIAAW